MSLFMVVWFFRVKFTLCVYLFQLVLIERSWKELLVLSIPQYFAQSDIGNLATAVCKSKRDFFVPLLVGFLH